MFVPQQDIEQRLENGDTDLTDVLRVVNRVQYLIDDAVQKHDIKFFPMPLRLNRFNAIAKVTLLGTDTRVCSCLI